MEADAPFPLRMKGFFGEFRSKQIGMPLGDFQPLLRTYPRIGFGVRLRFSFASEHFGHTEAYGGNTHSTLF